MRFLFVLCLLRPSFNSVALAVQKLVIPLHQPLKLWCHRQALACPAQVASEYYFVFCHGLEFMYACAHMCRMCVHMGLCVDTGNVGCFF